MTVIFLTNFLLLFKSPYFSSCFLALAGDDGNPFGRGGSRSGGFSFMMGGPGGAGGQNMNMNMGGMPGMGHRGLPS